MPINEVKHKLLFQNCNKLLLVKVLDITINYEPTSILVQKFDFIDIDFCSSWCLFER